MPFRRYGLWTGEKAMILSKSLVLFKAQRRSALMGILVWCLLSPHRCSATLPGLFTWKRFLRILSLDSSSEDILWQGTMIFAFRPTKETEDYANGKIIWLEKHNFTLFKFYNQRWEGSQSSSLLPAFSCRVFHLEMQCAFCCFNKHFCHFPWGLVVIDNSYKLHRCDGLFHPITMPGFLRPPSSIWFMVHKYDL